MKKARLLGALSACLLALSFSAKATYVDHGTYTTANGLDWLDLTVTANLSYDYVSTQFGIGGAYEGWRYATAAEVADFWTALGGTPPYTGSSAANDGLFGVVGSLWGDLSGTGNSYAIIAETNTGSSGQHWTTQMYDLSGSGWFNIFDTPFGDNNAFNTVGSALVRTTVVPVPAAAWLFGSGLLGLVGVARRKQAA